MASTPNRMMILALAIFCGLLVWGGSQYQSGPAATPKRWTVSNFLEFSRGTLGDAGANTYVTAAGEVKLINLWDLNRDGFIDIVLPNTHDNNEQIDLFIYWGVDENQVGRRTRLPSNGGVSQALGDLNGDGFTDLVVVNGRNGIKSNLNSFIYWGGAQGFAAERRAELPTLGAMAAAVGDLNRDGYPEIVFANSAGSGGRPSGPENASFLYWGSEDGFSIDRRHSLPTAAATDVAIADLNRDGSPEIVFANEGSGAHLGGAMIYWGGAGGSYSADRRTVLPGQRSSAVALADLNGDRVPEIVLANRYRPFMREPGDRSEWDTDVDSESIHSFVFWGSSQGYSAERRLELPTVAASSVAAADLNQDGLADLVFANGPQKSGHAAPGPGSGSPIYWNGAEGFETHRRTVLPTLNRDGWLELLVTNLMSAEGGRKSDVLVYWGAAEGYEADRVTRLPALGPEGVAVADLNADGHLDVVATSYHAGETRSHPSYIYWNSAGGLDESRVTHIPTHSGSGVMAADFNNDGVTDLLFACHKVEGAHRNLSFLYEGAPQGFSPERRQLLPGLGPHFLAGVDVGHVSDRGDRYDYISEVFDAGAPVRFETLGWEGETPFASAVEFQMRGADSIEALRQAGWRGPKGEGSVYAGRHFSLKGFETPTRFLQFKATLVGPNGTGAPVVRSVSVDYR